jgi:hypothetical protein
MKISNICADFILASIFMRVASAGAKKREGQAWELGRIRLILSQQLPLTTWEVVGVTSNVWVLKSLMLEDARCCWSNS